MTKNEIENKLYDIAKELKLKNCDIVVKKIEELIHIRIITDFFSGKSLKERENIFWKAIEEFFDDETIILIEKCELLTFSEYNFKF